MPGGSTISSADPTIEVESTAFVEYCRQVVTAVLVADGAHSLERANAGSLFPWPFSRKGKRLFYLMNNNYHFKVLTLKLRVDRGCTRSCAYSAGAGGPTSSKQHRQAPTTSSHRAAPRRSKSKRKKTRASFLWSRAPVLIKAHRNQKELQIVSVSSSTSLARDAWWGYRQ